MKRKEKHPRLSFCARGLCFLLGVCLLFGALSALLNDKMSRKYAGYFYDSGDDFEVLFFGSSHMFNGVAPLQLYRDTGVFSYNLGMTNEYPSVSYWRMVDALQRQDPKVVVVDVYRALSREKMPQTESDLSLLHNSLDAMPLGVTKVRAAADILDAGWNNLDTMFNFLFPLAQFHSRYRSLTEDDYHPYLLETRGAMPLRQWYGGQPLALENAPAGASAPLDSAPGEEYLRRIIELCADRGVAIVLLVLPYQAVPEEMPRLNGIAALADEYPNATYLNLVYEEIVDPLTDFSDAEGHLNTAGAAKVTAWLGRWLCEHYELTDRRGSEPAAAWDQSLANVRRQQATALTEAPDLTSALMLLVGQDFAFTVQADAAALEPPAVQALCAALGMPAAGGETLRWQSEGAPDVFTEGTGVVVFDPDSGEELGRTAWG